MNCASFRAGVMTTYLRTLDMLTGITDELFIGAGDWNRPVSPGGPRRTALYTSPACSYLARNNLIYGGATRVWAKRSRVCLIGDITKSVRPLIEKLHLSRRAYELPGK